MTAILFFGLNFVGALAGIALGWSLLAALNGFAAGACLMVALRAQTSPPRDETPKRALDK